MVLSQPLPQWTGLATLPDNRRPPLALNERTTDAQEQLPQFLPRTAWPEPELNFNDLPELDISIDWENANDVASLHQQVNDFFQGLAPMLPFQNDLAHRYRGSTWLSHVAILSQMLRDTLTVPSGGSLSAEEVNCLMTICSYGLSDAACFLAPWTLRSPPEAPMPAPPPSASQRTRRRNVRASQMPSTQADAPLVGGSRGGKASLERAPAVVTYYEEALQMNLANGTWPVADNERADLVVSIQGRRWIAAPIRHGDDLWCMTLFDRSNAELYIYDCVGPNRKERVEAIVHMWVRFWNWIGLSASFQYFVPGVDPSSWLHHSGWRSVLWLFENLRNRVGEQIRVTPAAENDDGGQQQATPRNDVVLVSKVPRPDIMDGSVFVHDAVPAGFNNAGNFWNTAKRFFTVLLCNELGIHRHVDFLRPANRSTRESLAAVADAMVNAARIPTDQCFTSLGGPMFVTTAGLDTYVDLDDRNRDFIPPPGDGNNGILIPNIPQAYNATPHQDHDIQWPQAPSYTAERRMNTLRPTALQPQDELDTPTSRRFRVLLSNEQTMLVGFVGIHRVAAADGTPAIQFSLEAINAADSPPGSTAAWTIVTIPLHPENAEVQLGEDNDDDDDDNDDNDGGGHDASSSGTHANSPLVNGNYIMDADVSFYFTPTPPSNGSEDNENGGNNGGINGGINGVINGGSGPGTLNPPPPRDGEAGKRRRQTGAAPKPPRAVEVATEKPKRKRLADEVGEFMVDQVAATRQTRRRRAPVAEM